MTIITQSLNLSQFLSYLKIQKYVQDNFKNIDFLRNISLTVKNDSKNFIIKKLQTEQFEKYYQD